MSESKVTVLNNGIVFDVPFDQCILDAGLAKGIALPHQCRGASCGQCKAHIEHGTVDHGWSFGFAITDEEKEQGYCLMCQAHPTSSELSIRTVEPFGEAIAPVVQLQGQVVAIEQLNHRVRRIIVQTSNAAQLFRPGAYAEIELPGITPNRMYSYSNGATDAGQLEFLVSLHPGGKASSYLHEQLRVGQVIDLKGPFGTCRLPEGNWNVLGMAGGTGLAPVISIFEHALASGATEDFLLLFSVLKDADAFELARLNRLQMAYPNFKYEMVVAEGPSVFCAQTGLITEYLGSRFDSLQGWRAVLSGSPGFVDAATTACVDLGMAQDAMSADSFTNVA